MSAAADAGDTAALNAADLAALPAAVRSELYAALQELNPARIEQVLAPWREAQPRLAATIQRMVGRYEYRQLCRMLEEAEGALP